MGLGDSDSPIAVGAQAAGTLGIGVTSLDLQSKPFQLLNRAEMPY